MASRKTRATARQRRRQILAAASELFSRRGFSAATTQQIARRAEINEAILFRHFPRKADLYWAVLEEKCQGSKLQQDWRQRLEESDDDAAVFAAIARDILRRSRRHPGITRLLLFSALENHELSGKFFREHIAKRYELLATHIRRRIKQGYFRPVDPLLAARGFMGMVVYHFLVQELFGGKRYQKMDDGKVCAALTQMWLQGIQSDQRNQQDVKGAGMLAGTAAD